MSGDQTLGASAQLLCLACWVLSGCSSGPLRCSRPPWPLGSSFILGLSSSEFDACTLLSEKHPGNYYFFASLNPEPVAVAWGGTCRLAQDK